MVQVGLELKTNHLESDSENTIQLYLFNDLLIVGVTLLDGVVDLLHDFVALLDGHFKPFGSCCEEMLGWPYVVTNAVC
jgi:hypothetical protein